MESNKINGKVGTYVVAGLLVAAVLVLGGLVASKLPLGSCPGCIAATATPAVKTPVISTTDTPTPAKTPVPVTTVEATVSVPVPNGTAGVKVSLVSAPKSGGTDCATSQTTGDDHIAVDWPDGAQNPIDVYAGGAPAEDIIGVVSCGDGRHVEYEWLAGTPKAAFTWGSSYDYKAER